MQLKNKVIALTSVMIGLTACHSGGNTTTSTSLEEYVDTLDYVPLDTVRASASFQQTMQLTRTTFLESMTMSFYAGANCSGTLESSLVFTGGISLPAGNYTTSNASAYWDCSHYSGTSGVGCAAEFTDTGSIQMIYYTSEYGVIGICANSKIGLTTSTAACTSATDCGFVLSGTQVFGGWTDQVPIPNSWAWMGGSNQGNQNGIYPANPYPSAGYESAGNVPRARYGSMSWTNESGLWLFGGYVYAGYYINDLWLYNPTTQQWAWMGGSKVTAQKGVYPSESYPVSGYESAGNIPGARRYSVSWTTESGLWLFGGEGYVSTGNAYLLNDLWLYNDQTHQWGWMGGGNQGNQNGIYPANPYPAVDYESVGNIPGARGSSMSWTNESGLWLFGGVGSGGSTNYLNDLWLYNPTTHQWAWMSGSNQGNQKGIYPANSYPAQGYESAGNTPGSRFGSVTWIDESGLWLFGGTGYDIDTGSAVNFLNDLWLYNPTTHQWAWMSGSNQGNQNGIYPANSYPSVDYESAGNMPGARRYSVSWTTESGLWLFGGYGRGGSFLNDLWLYNTKTHQWAWMGGSKQINQYGVYPIGSGFESAANMPGSRYSSISWSTESGLWLFGGVGYDIDTGSASNYLNDLWLFNPANVHSLPPT